MADEMLGEGGPNPLEERINSLRDKLDEIDDLQLVNKLDIVNLKNEIEKLKLVSSPMSPEVIERLKELEKVVENAQVFVKLKHLAENADRLLAGAHGRGVEGLEDMIKVVDDINRRVGRLEAGGTGMKPGELASYGKRVEELRASLGRLPRGAKEIVELSKGLERLRLIVEDNSRRIVGMSKAPKAAARPVAKAAAPRGVKCTKCRAPLPPHAKFCGKCGTRL